MKSTRFAMLVCAALFLPALQAVANAAPADKVDAKAVAAAKKKSMAEKGFYHRVHAQKEKLDCKDCHSKKPFPDATLMLRLHEPLAKDSPGPVSSDSCHECHGKKQKKHVTWYAPKESKD